MLAEVTLFGHSETLKRLSRIDLKTSGGDEIRLRNWSGDSLGAAAIIAENEAEPLKTASRLHRSDRSAPILILCDNAQTQILKNNLLMTANIGLDTQVLPNHDINALAEALVSQVELSLKRRRHRERIFGAQQSLSASGAYQPPSPLILNRLLDQLPIGVMTVGNDQKLLNLNPAAQRLLGIDAGDAIDKPLAQWLPPQSASLVASLISQALQSGQTGRRVLQLGDADKPQHLEFMSSRADPEHAERGALVLIEDVTQEVLADQKRDEYETLLSQTNQELEKRVAERTQDLEAAKSILEERNRQLQRSNDDLEKFSFIAAHDLSEPLRKISLFADLLDSRSRDILDDEARKYLGSMQRSSTHLRHLIESLLTYSRLNNVEIQRQPTDFTTLVDNVCKDLEPSIKECGAKVECGTLPSLAVDPVLIQQVFQNLITNALRYRKQGVPPIIRITSHSDTDTGYCEIAVRDYGIGFNPEYRERIFLPFERLRIDNGEKGSGIGLAICYQICERHGGSISADAEPDKGAVFRIRLPLSAPN